MAAGEYVSVSSQADTERADLDRERAELATDGENEHAELAAIYVARGLDPALASQVATQLMAKDALVAHARDELGISDTLSARPVQAAFASAGSFTVGAILPLLLVFFVPREATHLDGFRRLLGFPCTVRRGSRTLRRLVHRQVRRPRDFLGRVGYGDHCRRRQVVRRGLIAQYAKLVTRPERLCKPRESSSTCRVGGCLLARARHGWRKNIIESNAMRLS
jgi:hypothetical protein